ncbi:hypothetical protein PVNG_05042 [Plasmodium vivax North Korean]|uniref:VIR protein n=1 Tax=Plasmodium vivax North Korean TaxID=1035514 RepID=A0A0J9U2I1_PLAVI|nr:hypothetical protein PVNG_05042 [Plasmodium vivax North Korean]
MRKWQLINIIRYFKIMYACYIDNIINSIFIILYYSSTNDKKNIFHISIVKYFSYDFFDKISEYIKHSDNVVSDGPKLDTGDDCNSFSEMYAKGSNTVWKNICEQFIKLCKLLPYLNNNKKDQNYRNDWNFLSYWLNFKLEENNLNGVICPYDFYSKMENYSTETLLPLIYSSNLIYNIDNEHLSRMKVLYILHDNYVKLDTIINKSTPPNPESLLEYSSTCSDNYKRARYLCEDKYRKFCEKLDSFKKNYEELFITAEGKGEQYTNNFKKLTEYDNSNIISTTLIGSAAGLIPLLGILYKFTPIGQVFNSQKRKLPKGHSNNIDEIMKTSLLNYENEQLNFNQEKYNIEYHPARIR